MADVLVTTEWLAAHLGDDNLVVAEVDENPELYDEGHIPGAVKLHWREDLQDPVRRDLVDRETFEHLLAERGIDISHETIRFWWNRFGPMFAAEIRKNRVARLAPLPPVALASG